MVARMMKLYALEAKASMREDATIASRILRIAIITTENSLEVWPSFNPMSTSALRKVGPFAALVVPREREAKDSWRVLLRPAAAQSRSYRSTIFPK